MKHEFAFKYFIQFHLFSTINTERLTSPCQLHRRNICTIPQVRLISSAHLPFTDYKTDYKVGVFLKRLSHFPIMNEC